MPLSTNPHSRRLFLKMAGCALTASALSPNRAAAESRTLALFDGQTLNGWIDSENKAAVPGWTVKDGAIASTGAGRGVLYSAKDYTRYRLMFTMRHVSGNPDHQACILIFCTRPQAGEKPLDALGGIQFQVPNGGHWDYRPGRNTSGGPEFTAITRTQFDPHAWCRVELLVDAAKGAARMAVAQPPGAAAVEVLDFNDPTAGRPGPIALQMHNAGLFDEYKDITLEPDPEDRLTTVK